jgi:hypothetical protein
MGREDASLSAHNISQQAVNASRGCVPATTHCIAPIGISHVRRDLASLVPARCSPPPPPCCPCGCPRKTMPGDAQLRSVRCVAFSRRRLAAPTRTPRAARSHPAAACMRAQVAKLAGLNGAAVDESKPYAELWCGWRLARLPRVRAVAVHRTACPALWLPSAAPSDALAHALHRMRSTQRVAGWARTPAARPR